MRDRAAAGLYSAHQAGYLAGRNEDKTDEGVWAITCTLTRTPYRWRGFTYQMIAAAVEFARQRGAHAVEKYAMLTEPGKEITWVNST